MRHEPVSIVVPAGAQDDQRPLLVFLHGRDDDEDTTSSTRCSPVWTSSATARRSSPPPMGATPPTGTTATTGTGGLRRRRGDPGGGDGTGADPDRVAIGGISMGGFGAFDIARLHPGAFCAVGGHSPAIWGTSERPLPGRSTTPMTLPITISLPRPGPIQRASWARSSVSTRGLRSVHPRRRRLRGGARSFGPEIEAIAGPAVTRAATGMPTGTSTCVLRRALAAC